MIDDRFEENWQAYTCSDCDPTLGIDDGGSDGFEKPYVMLVPVGEAVPDHCPRCGHYLSMCDGDNQLRITNTPAERWAAKQSAESAD